MKKLLVVMLLVLTLFSGCATLQSYGEGGNEETFDGHESWDNNKNLAWIPLSVGRMYPYVGEECLSNLQKWIDDNPDKVVVSVSSDSSNYMTGGQLGWLIIYKLKE